MSQFLTKLRVELVDQQAAQGRGTWKLTSPLIYTSDVADDNFVVPVDFVTDFASTPRIPIIFDLLGDVAAEAAVLHDFLYKTAPVSRSTADKILKEAAISTGCPKWQAWGLYIGVRIGGWKFYKG